jgi:hypothetical protein
VVRGADAVLQQAEEPVDGLRVNVALDVDAGLVADAAVDVADPVEPLVGLPLKARMCRGFLGP